MGNNPCPVTKLTSAKQLQLDVDDWEVGLAEIIYPHSWNNINDARFTIRYQEGGVSVWQDVTVPDALYEQPNDLVQALNEAVNEILPTEQTDSIHFVYNTLMRKFTACVKPGYVVRFRKSLSVALGLGDHNVTLRCSRDSEDYGISRTDERVIYDSDKIIGDFMVDLNRGLHTFFIYCNVVESQLVGDAHVPLLRTVAVKGRNGEVVSHSFDNVHYVPLSRSTFQELLIHISDDTGQRVPFQYGRVIAKLHFRRK